MTFKNQLPSRGLCTKQLPSRGLCTQFEVVLTFGYKTAAGLNHIIIPQLGPKGHRQQS